MVFYTIPNRNETPGTHKLASPISTPSFTQEKLEQASLKLKRQEKAAAGFSKQKFIEKHHKQPTGCSSLSADKQGKTLKKERQKVENLKVDLMAVLKSKVSPN